MKYYKVVRKFNGKLVSVSTYGKYQVEYKIGETTKPKIGKLFVFNSLLSARNYISNIEWQHNYPNDKAIFECEIRKPSLMRYIGDYRDDDMKMFWENRNLRIEQRISKEYRTQFSYHIAYRSPCGTYCASEVKLLKEV